MSGTLEQLEGPGGTELFDIPGALRPAADTPAPPQYRTLVTRSNGDVLPTILVDGYVAGVWRPMEAGRDARAYSRYFHWWAKLPEAEVRILPRSRRTAGEAGPGPRG